MAQDRQAAASRNYQLLFNVGTTAGLTDGQLLERFNTRLGEIAELAFAVLVERHGPMILRTCRGVLRDDHESQDALQATFLILARSGTTLWVRDSLGPWLHRVALRVALRAKRASNRRKTAERKAAEMMKRTNTDKPWDDLEGKLHQEIDRLPDCFRIPIVLCDLEGRSYEDAARHLGCPVGTVKSRLARGRERLRGELTQQGFAPSSHALDLALAPQPLPPVLPSTLLVSIAQTTLQLVSEQAQTTGIVSHAVLTLANEVLRSMMLTRLKWAASLLLILASAATGAGFVVAKTSAPPQERRDPAVVEAQDPGSKPSQASELPIARTEEAVGEKATFEQIQITGRLKVIIAPGPEYHVSLIGGGARTETPRARIEKVSGHKRLILELPPPEAPLPDQPEEEQATPEVRVTTPRPLEVVAKGPAKVEIRDFKDKTLVVSQRDSAKVRVSGTCERLVASLENTTELDASWLAAKSADIVASGQSRSVLQATSTLNLNLSQNATVEYFGSPEIHQIRSGQPRLIHRPEPAAPSR